MHKIVSARTRLQKLAKNVDWDKVRQGVFVLMTAGLYLNFGRNMVIDFRAQAPMRRALWLVIQGRRRPSWKSDWAKYRQLVKGTAKRALQQEALGVAYLAVLWLLSRRRAS